MSFTRQVPSFSAPYGGQEAGLRRSLISPYVNIDFAHIPPRNHATSARKSSITFSQRRNYAIRIAHMVVLVMDADAILDKQNESATQDLAVKRDRSSFARRRLRQQALGVGPQHLFEIDGIKPVQHMAQRVQGRRPLQTDAEMPVEVITPLIEKGNDAPVGPGAAQQRKNRGHQKVRQRIALALRTARIGNIGQSSQKTGKQNHCNSSRPELLTDY